MFYLISIRTLTFLVDGSLMSSGKIIVALKSKYHLINIQTLPVRNEFTKNYSIIIINI